MLKISLKYRIAVIIFLLEAVMMFTVLRVTLNSIYEANEKNIEIKEQAMLELLSELARISLFTSEYGDIQAYFEQIVVDPQVEKILVVKSDKNVVVSSDTSDIGEKMPPLEKSGYFFWRKRELRNHADTMGYLVIKFSHAKLMLANRAALNLGISLAVVGMAITAFVGVLIGHLLTRRLNRLTMAAHKIAAGNLTAKTGLVGKDEVAVVGQAFDQMSTNIKKYVSDLEDQRKELELARDKALEADRMKGEFLNNISHELRTPLTSIIGYSNVVIQELEKSGDKDSVKNVKIIRNSGKRLSRLIENILNLSTEKRNNDSLELSKFNVKSTLAEIVTTFQPLTKENNNTLELDADESIGEIESDYRKIYQIMFILLSNATKFSKNGTIFLKSYIDGSGEDEKIVFKVIDDGIGVEPSHQAKLFDEFYQVDSSSTRRYGGAGLGLATAKSYCDLLHGEIGVSSKPGEGSEFSVILPRFFSKQNGKKDYQPAMVTG